MERINHENTEAILAIATQLVKLGMDPNAKDEYGSTAFHSLVKRSFNGDNVPFMLAAITMLVDLGMDPNAQDEYGHTAFYRLFSAFNMNDKDATLHLLTSLVQLGVDPRIGFEEGKASTLHILMGRLSHENKDTTLAVATKPVELGVNPNARNETSNIVIHDLLYYVPDQNATHDEETTPMNSSTNLVQPRHFDGLTALHFLIRSLNGGNVEIVMKVANKLLDLGVDPNVQTQRGYSALHYLHTPLKRGYVEATLTVAETLVALGSELNNPAEDGKTVLHYLVDVAIDKDVGTLLALITKFLVLGADPNTVDETGKTCLHTLAMKSKSSSDREGICWGQVAATLHHHGADPTIQDTKGNLPLDYSSNPTMFDPTAVFLSIQHMALSGSYGSTR